MSPDQAILQSVMDEIKRDAEIEYMLSDEFIQKDNILRHLFDGISGASSDVPAGLHRAFMFHAIIDLLFGLPLMIAPEKTLRWMGWDGPVDPVASRIAAAALLAGTGYFVKQLSLDEHKLMLDLKLIWSSAAIIGLGLSLWEGAEKAAWLPLGIFTSFWAMWVYWKRRLG